ncbi:hypothetical protein BOW51_00815 [Solemya velesiana gill symbiont]|uniref:Chemotaxis protein methyltransferase n=2 Tax=Solemya velesiana gill symbiont TaxID=1918948 RepID=A0A1T2KY27_9GAMM|nr:hypothetical protein BOW51_00815 [Solemya velesiana gill symbiont]
MEGRAAEGQHFAPRDYQAFQQFLEQACGIVLGSDKEYLVASRLSGLMQERGLVGMGELLQQLESGASANLKAAVIDAMTTNETFWFRDKPHFQMLEHKILPEIAATPGHRLRIWSAACSSGQEPYSISMTVEEFKQINPTSFTGGVDIMATDISRTMLETARKGVYCGFSAARGLDDQQRNSFFEDKGQCLGVRDELKCHVAFRELNLTRGYGTLGRFDIIFCRNVLIYFSPEQKKAILERFTSSLNPGGYLFLGSTESLSAYSDQFEMVKEQGGIAYRLR